GGGNKTRKLEFLMADAIGKGARAVITTGAVQSNHCRLTAAAATREGLECHLVLEERVPHSDRRDGSGNNFLFHLLGVTSITVVPAGTDLPAAMEKVRVDLEGRGVPAYLIPGGGSNPIGALGYVSCADEILSQSFEMGVEFDSVVCASGSGGTHAGLLAGFIPQGGPPIDGVSVRFDSARQAGRLAPLVRDTLALLGHAAPESLPIVVHDGYVGEGYSLPTDGMVEAVQLVARTEAVLLDPVYTGKAMAGVIDFVRSGHWRAGQDILFVHTGGAPALHAYEGVLDPDRAVSA
ncbi:MAG: D-cysteine desulfhydrase family protein, partial [Candidatus Limnocylindria bacterium]